MKFEHLIQINDPKLPYIPPLTRQELWHGLVARAHTPALFILGMESCSIEKTETQAELTRLHRRLNYGAFELEDTVELVHMSHTVTLVKASHICPESRMRIRIEEPEAGALFLRFSYEWASDESAADFNSTVEGLRKQAYINADVDTVQKIRELAQSAQVSGSERMQ